MRPATPRPAPRCTPRSAPSRLDSSTWSAEYDDTFNRKQDAGGDAMLRYAYRGALRETLVRQQVATAIQATCIGMFDSGLLEPGQNRTYHCDPASLFTPLGDIKEKYKSYPFFQGRCSDKTLAWVSLPPMMTTIPLKSGFLSITKQWDQLDAKMAKLLSSPAAAVLGEAYIFGSDVAKPLFERAAVRCAGGGLVPGCSGVSVSMHTLIHCSGHCR